MYQVDFDKFNIILDNLLNQYNCYNKNAKEFFNTYFHNARRSILNLDAKYEFVEKKQQVLFLKILHMMLIAHKYVFHFEKDNMLNLYNNSDENYFDITMFLKDNAQELELFRLYFNELENNSKLNLTFYDDKVNNYEFQFIDKKTTLFDQMQRVNNINNLKSESKKFLNRGIIQGAHDINYAATLAGEIINIEEKNDSLFNEIYTKIQHNEKASLYILRKKLLRQSFLEMNTYNIYLNHLREQHFSNPNDKKLLKSYPYIDVFCKMKNN